jgi:hypothetical protein
MQSKTQTLRQACTVRPRKAPDSTQWWYIAFRYTVGSLIAGTNIHPHPPRYLGSYKSGNGRKSQKEYTIYKKAYKKSKPKHPKPITMHRIATGIGIGSHIEGFCHRERITPDNIGCHGLRCRRTRHRRSSGEVQIPMNPWSFL